MNISNGSKIVFRFYDFQFFQQRNVFDPLNEIENVLTSSNGEYSFSTVCAASTAATAPAKSAPNIFDDAWKYSNIE